MTNKDFLDLGINYLSSETDIINYLTLRQIGFKRDRLGKYRKIRRRIKQSEDNYFDALDLGDIFNINQYEADVLIEGRFFRKWLGPVREHLDKDDVVQFYYRIVNEVSKAEKIGLTPIEEKGRKEYGSFGLYFRDVERYFKRYSLLGLEDGFQLAQLAQHGDIGARNKIIETNQYLVIKLAGQIKKATNTPIEDLISAGNIGLMKAIEKFDFSHSFVNYAVWQIKSEIYRVIKNDAELIHLPANWFFIHREIRESIREIEQELGINVDIEERLLEIVDRVNAKNKNLLKKFTLKGVKDVLYTVRNITSIDSILMNCAYESPYDLDYILESKKETTVGECIPDDAIKFPYDGNEELIESVMGLVSNLKERESNVIKLYFGIGVEREYNLNEIGKKIGLTRQRVRQIKETALRKLRREAHKNGLEQLTE